MDQMETQNLLLPRDELIKRYYIAGYACNEILSFLRKYHQISLSLRHLHRLLRELGLYRRKNQTRANDLLLSVNGHLSGSSFCLGYRSMHQLLRKSSINASKESVRLCLLALDPDGVALRKSKKLRRRLYISKGPDFTWHIDGYDKLKPYGFAIHGAIDGFSRKVLWLNVGPTNSNPRIVASYFLKAVKDVLRIPKLVRADRGSENVVLGGIQQFLRRNFTDSLAGVSSFRYGSSVTNQRIESWWSQLRKLKCSWWINFFKDFADSGLLDINIDYHLELVRFCFMGIIQAELNEIENMWNTHYIRNVRNSECPAGRPNVLCFLPEQADGKHCGFHVNVRDLNIAKEVCEEPSLVGCSELVFTKVLLIMRENSLDYPKTATEAANLYIFLAAELDRYIR